jgi:excinuclease UvrABC ATPase subunit
MRGAPGSKVLITGSGGTRSTDYEGLADLFERLYLKRDLSGMSRRTRDLVQRFLVDGVCPERRGARLNAAALATRIGGRNIADLSRMADVESLLGLLDRLVDRGNTVVVVEHDLRVVAHADWIIDLGPDGRRDGGRVIFEGTPTALLGARGSATAEHLRRATD